MSKYVNIDKVLDIYAELYDVFDDSKEIQKELHKVYDKLNDLSVAGSCSICEEARNERQTDMR